MFCGANIVFSFSFLVRIFEFGDLPMICKDESIVPFHELSFNWVITPVLWDPKVTVCPLLVMPSVCFVVFFFYF